MNDKIIAKIRKLLAMAQDAGASESEREHAIRVAHKLLARHNLDLASVEAGSVQENRDATSAVFHGTPWARTVASSLAGLFFCSYYFMKSNNSDNAHHFFIGRESNATTAVEVAKFVVTAIQREATAWQRGRGAHYSDYRAFAAGAAKSVYIRCAVMRAEQEKETAADTAAPAPGSGATPGTAVVLATVYQREAEANEAWVKAHVPDVKLRASRAHAVRAGDAYFSGRNYGANVSLAVQVGGSTQKLVR